MKKITFIGTAMILGLSIYLTAGTSRAAAQGPAGSGAAAAAQDSANDSRIPNPIKWLKKDSRNPAEDVDNRSDVEKKLTPSLQAHGMLPVNATATDACAPFTLLEGCLAALHASHNLGVDFYCLRASDTGVHTSVDVSGCKAADGDKAAGLSGAIHQLKPDANAKQATKEAEQQAKDDLSGAAQ